MLRNEALRLSRYSYSRIEEKQLCLFKGISFFASKLWYAPERHLLFASEKPIFASCQAKEWMRKCHSLLADLRTRANERLSSFTQGRCW